MATLMKIVTGLATNLTFNSVKTVCSTATGCAKQLLGASMAQQTQVRTRYVDWRMLRDVKRRKMVKEYEPLRLRINSLRKNNILPKELQEIADKEIAALPKDSSRTRLAYRCCITSRARGNIRRFRICRIQLRHLIDYNKMSGLTRSSW